MKIVSTNPSKNYEVIGEVEVTFDEAIGQKVANANLAKEQWRRLGIEKRAELLRSVLAIFEMHADQIAALITKEVGTPIAQCKDEVNWNWSYWEWFLTEGVKSIQNRTLHEDDQFKYLLTYEPLGTAAVITPWNLPFDLFVWGVVPNLLAGNVVVYKASEECILTGQLLEAIMVETSLPKGVFSAVHGDSRQGDVLTQQAIDLIWFTGSSEVGKLLYERAGKKFIKAILEMGGSNPAIVLEDADPVLVADRVFAKRFMFCGQTCDAVKRLIVHKSIADDVVSRLKQKVEQVVVGDPEDLKITMGPLVSKKQRDILTDQVSDSITAGATCVVGGSPPESLQGAYYMPTILTNVTRSMPVWKEEVFGPVLAVVTFETEEESIVLANDSQYGLSAQVYSGNIDRAARIATEIKAGNVDINGANHFKPWCPFGGYKSSGMGREHGEYGMQELCQLKVLSIKK